MTEQTRGYWRKLFKGCETLFSAMRTTFPYMVGASNDRKEITEEYPDRVSARMPEDLPQRFRGFLYNDIEACSGCLYCTETCPINCIRIERERGPSGAEDWVAVFDINHSRCMFCGLCVEVCPTKSLQHTKEYQGSVFLLPDLIQEFGRGWATAEMKQRWIDEQKSREAKAEEQEWLKRSPVGAELRRRKKSEDDKK